MSRYLNTKGNAVLSVAICDRCKMKRAIGELVPDPNAPGLRVCEDKCVDIFDPWRLPARMTEKVAVQYPRPDEDIGTDGTTVGPPTS